VRVVREGRVVGGCARRPAPRPRHGGDPGDERPEGSADTCDVIPDAAAAQSGGSMLYAIGLVADLQSPRAGAPVGRSRRVEDPLASIVVENAEAA
jgi:hypothetical protein